MRILGLDTATAGCSATLIDGDDVRAARREIMRRGQSERLIPMVQDVMAEAGLTLHDLDGFGVTTGPGAFTGLRIGLAAARGFALATGKPAVGIGTFEATLAALSDATIAGRHILVAIASGRDEIFAQIFAPDRTPVGPPLNRSQSEIATAIVQPTVIVGDGWPAEAKLPPAVERIDAGPVDAGIVARLAAARIVQGGPTEKPRPFYLRDADTSVPKRAAPRIAP
jgi:tRNA threonylcarbamoyladenosine biosynthesis protein TsaB